MRRTILLPVTLCAPWAPSRWAAAAPSRTSAAARRSRPTNSRSSRIRRSPCRPTPSCVRRGRASRGRRRRTPADQAKEALSPALAGRVQAQRQPAGAGAPGDASEQALVAKAGAGGVDPNIRSQVNRDTRTLAEKDNTFIDSLIFWQDKPPPGVVLDPDQGAAAPARRPGRRAAARAAPTPTIERRKRGLLEGIF